jgi:hypothetical protein
MQSTALPQEHKDLISTICLLPEIPVIAFWRKEQSGEIKRQKNLWKWTGGRIDYLQQKQMGFLIDDPANLLTIPILKTKLIVRSDYFFCFLQVIIDGFDIIKSAAHRKGKDFPFNNPREVLAAICKEQAQEQINEITSRDIGNGVTISQARKEQSLIGKFYRGSLSDEETEALCLFFEDSGLLTGFVIASIYQGTGKRYLKKWHSWQQFKKAHKNYCKYLNSPETHLVKWEGGHPVWTDTCQPVLYEES